MHLIGTFVLHCLRHGILFYARYVLGKFNQIINSQSHFLFLKLFVAVGIGKVAFLLMMVFDNLKKRKKIERKTERAMLLKTINTCKEDFVITSF